MNRFPVILHSGQIHLLILIELESRKLEIRISNPNYTKFDRWISMDPQIKRLIFARRERESYQAWAYG